MTTQVIEKVVASVEANQACVAELCQKFAIADDAPGEQVFIMAHQKHFKSHLNIATEYGAKDFHEYVESGCAKLAYYMHEVQFN